VGNDIIWEVCESVLLGKFVKPSYLCIWEVWEDLLFGEKIITTQITWEVWETIKFGKFRKPHQNLNVKFER
jgi:hypothetical protein